MNFSARAKKLTHRRAAGPRNSPLMETGEVLKVCMLPDETCA